MWTLNVIGLLSIVHKDGKMFFCWIETELIIYYKMYHKRFRRHFELANLNHCHLTTGFKAMISSFRKNFSCFWLKRKNILFLLLYSIVLVEPFAINLESLQWFGPESDANCYYCTYIYFVFYCECGWKLKVWTNKKSALQCN